MPQGYRQETWLQDGEFSLNFISVAHAYFQLIITIIYLSVAHVTRTRLEYAPKCNRNRQPG